MRASLSMKRNLGLIRDGVLFGEPLGALQQAADLLSECSGGPWIGCLGHLVS